MMRTFEDEIRLRVEHARTEIGGHVTIYFWSNATGEGEWNVTSGYGADEIKVTGANLDSCVQEYIRRKRWRETQKALNAPLEATAIEPPPAPKPLTDDDIPF